jgi:predicted acyltransferase
VGYLVCTILLLNTTVTKQFVLTAVLLFLYWMIFLFVPVPGWQGGHFSSQMNIAVYLDNIVLGPFHRAGSCQLLRTINFISNMLLGVLMGHILKSTQIKKDKIILLFTCGLAMFFAGSVWGQFFPVIRNLWTSSYVLVTCGMSTVLLAVFYLVIDVLGYSKWAFPLVVFGVNSIAVYMMAHMFDFKLIGNIFVGGLSRFLALDVQNFVEATTALIVIWLIMYWMYCKKTFIKI